MDENCQDVFREYELPFKTFFSREINHQNQIHEDTELVWVISGKVNLECEGLQYTLVPHTLFMINAYQNHSIQSSADALIITYRFTRQYLERNNFHFKKMQFVNRLYSIEELVKKYKAVPLLISQLIKLLISEKNSFLVRYKIIGYYNILIYELYTLLLKEKSLDVKKKNCVQCLNRVNTIIDFVNTHYNREVSLDDLAAKIGLSRYRLSHFIKEQMGISFRDYVMQIRFDNAVKLLRETEMKVLDIAKASGFSDVKYLNQMMKSKFQTTALKYRKQIRTGGVSSVMKEANFEQFLQELRSFLNPSPIS